MTFKKYKHQEDFIFKDLQIVLTEAGLKKALAAPKKITGSRFASVLGKNKYVSPFQAWCDILGFYKSDIDPMYAEAGTLIEPKLIEFAGKKLGKKYHTVDPVTIGFDAFKQEKIFGGMPDGVEKDGNTVVSIVEIKTTAIDKFKWEKQGNEFKLVKDGLIPIVTKPGGGISNWFSGKNVSIPITYQYQLALYLYLHNISTGHFCIGFLNVDDYINPKGYKNNYVSYKYSDLDAPDDLSQKLKDSFKQERVIIIEEFNVDLFQFKELADKAEAWYKKHVYKGISPVMTLEDIAWFKYGFPDI